MVEVFVAAALLLWIAVTVLYQIDLFARRISRYDTFRLVPRWTFFSPNPGQHDLHLLIRDIRTDGSVSDWREALVGRGDYAIPVLWNPNKRMPKILWDCWHAIHFALFIRKLPPEQIPINGGYLMLLHLAMRERAEEEARERQFALARSTGFENRRLDVIFVSVYHAFD